MSITAFTRQLGWAVRERRLAEGLTQRQLAQASGVSERLVRSLEMGEATSISLERLVSILGQLDLELTLSNSAPAPSQASQNEAYSELLAQAVRSWSADAKIGSAHV